jgi:hypothetical protein
MARTASSPLQSTRQASTDNTQTFSSPMAQATETTGVGHSPGEAEYRTWSSNTPNHTHYSPSQANPASVAESSVSPRTLSSEGTAEMARGRGGSLGSGASLVDPMVDVDWNEWDKMFPPDVNLSDFGNLPDFHFSTLLPNKST